MADKELTVPATSSNKGEAKIAPKHPPTADMVNNALKTLDDRGGSSLYAIKKFITTTYMLDADKLSLYIKKYLKSAVANGKVKQMKGIGASGSFKLAAAKSEPKKSVAAKPKHVTGDEKPKAKKSDEKKKKSAAKSDDEKKAISPKKAATPSKQKSTKPKADAKKPKVPKPKTASSSAKIAAPKKAVTPKKVAAPKKTVAPKKIGEPKKLAAPKKAAEPKKVAAPKKA